MFNNAIVHKMNKITVSTPNSSLPSF
jgi:hypothetical protein